MDIEDAEYQEWVNIQEDCTTKPLDNKRVLCEYWSLKNDPDVKVIGTELQCYEYAEAYKDNNKKPLIINLK